MEAKGLFWPWCAQLSPARTSPCCDCRGQLLGWSLPPASPLTTPWRSPMDSCGSSLPLPTSGLFVQLAAPATVGGRRHCHWPLKRSREIAAVLSKICFQSSSCLSPRSHQA